MPGVGITRSLLPLSEPGLAGLAVTLFELFKLSEAIPEKIARTCVVAANGTVPLKDCDPPTFGAGGGETSLLPVSATTPGPEVWNRAPLTHVSMVTVPPPGRIVPLKS